MKPFFAVSVLIFAATQATAQANTPQSCTKLVHTAHILKLDDIVEANGGKLPQVNKLTLLISSASWDTRYLLHMLNLDVTNEHYNMMAEYTGQGYGALTDFHFFKEVESLKKARATVEAFAVHCVNEQHSYLGDSIYVDAYGNYVPKNFD